MIQSGRVLGSLLSKLAGPLMKVTVPIAENILAPLGVTAASSAIDARIKKTKQNEIHGSGTTTLIISNEEMDDIINIVKALEDSDILLKEITETIQNQAKERKHGFLSMLLGTLASTLLGNMLAGKVIVSVGYGNKQGEGIVRAGYGSSIKKSSSSTSSSKNV